MELRAASIIDVEIGGHYAFIPFAEQISTRLHRHDFYEVFLIAQGEITHHINGQVQHLTSGSLILIRPDDAHCFSQTEHKNCELINVAFLTPIFDAVVSFLELQRHLFATPELPLMKQLNSGDKKRLQEHLQYWGRLSYRDALTARRNLRALLAQIVSEHFASAAVQISEPMPPWLHQVIVEMKKQEHFIEGRVALLRLAKRTPEYVGRVFQQYLDKTPSQFINDLRLDYAGDLLLHTEQSPTEIAFEAGFGNVSYFYQLFKARWGCSPNQFRKDHRQTLIL